MLAVDSPLAAAPFGGAVTVELGLVEELLAQVEKDRVGAPCGERGVEPPVGATGGVMLSTWWAATSSPSHWMPPLAIASVMAMRSRRQRASVR